ncbi:MAG: HDOD domain-containing protein [Candidatus Zixiibacteriota bacterium]
MLAEKAVLKFIEEGHELRTLPAVLAEIIRVTSNPDVDINLLERVVSKDPVLAAQILKRANSSFYGRKADTVRQAIWNVGWEAAKAISLSTAIFDKILKWHTKIDLKSFWRHSLEVAITSRLLARKMIIKNPENNYAIGLLHDIGILVLDQLYPEQYIELFDIFMPDEDLAELEKQFFETDHCEIGSELLRLWNLPMGLWDTVRTHHNLCRNGDDDLETARLNKDATILALADLISDMQFRPSDHGIIISSQHQHLLMAAAELSSEDIYAVKEEVAELMVEESAFLDYPVGNASELARMATNALLDQAADMVTHFADRLNGEIRRDTRHLNDDEKKQVVEKYSREMSIVENLWTEFKMLNNELQGIQDAISIGLMNNSLRDFIFRMSERVVEGVCIALNRMDENHDTCHLFYGTNREPIYSKDADSQVIGYGSEPSPALHVGRVKVKIPRYRKLGSLSADPIGRLIKPDDRIFVENIEELLPEIYWQHLRNALKDSVEGETPDLLIYIHGYWHSFDRAARRAAQLHVDLQVNGMTAFYSWPSAANFAGYVSDLERAQESAGYLQQFLWTAATECRPANIHIIAHSMGNRALLTSIEKIANEVTIATGIPFSQIILAAPDITVDQFKALAHAYRKIGVRTTIYVSRKDKAILGSRLLRLKNMDLVGRIPPVTIEDGMDTIEATRVDNTFWGHNYFCGSGPVINDISTVIRKGTPPENRPNIITRRSEKDNRMYYQLLEKLSSFKLN